MRKGHSTSFELQNQGHRKSNQILSHKVPKQTSTLKLKFFCVLIKITFLKECLQDLCFLQNLQFGYKFLVVQVVAHYFFKIDIHWFLLALLLPMIVMNWINNLKYLTPVSLFASLLTSSSLGIIFFYMLQGTVAG